MRRLCRLALAALLLAVSLPAPAPGEVIDRVVARVADTVITWSDLMRMFPIYVQVVGIDPALLDSEDGQAEAARLLLDHLVDVMLLLAEAEERDLSVTEDELDSYLAQQRESMGMDAQAFSRALEREGIDSDDFREFMRGNLTRMRMIQVDVVSELSVPDEEVEREIQRRYPDGLVRISMTTSHILVQVPEGAGPEDEVVAETQIRGLWERLAAGESFEEIAAATNPDGTRNTGGRVGTFRLGELDPDYERAAVNLEEGSWSEPVRTRFGWHVVRLDRILREEVEDADTIRRDVRFELEEEEATRQEGQYLARLRSRSFVSVHEDALLF